MVILPPLQIVLLVNGHQCLVELIVYGLHADKSKTLLSCDFHSVELFNVHQC